MKEGLEDEEYETEDDKRDLEDIIHMLESYWDRNDGESLPNPVIKTDDSSALESKRKMKGRKK